VPENPVALFQIDCANRPAGLIQDQPCAVYTEFLVKGILNKDHHDLLAQNRKQKTK